MMATSARIREPMNESRPTRIQAIMINPNSEMFLATSCGFLNTPEPMTVPMTMAVPIQGPSTRESSEFVGLSMGISDNGSVQNDCAAGDEDDAVADDKV